MQPNQVLQHLHRGCFTGMPLCAGSQGQAQQPAAGSKAMHTCCKLSGDLQEPEPHLVCRAFALEGRGVWHALTASVCQQVCPFVNWKLLFGLPGAAAQQHGLPAACGVQAV